MTGQRHSHVWAQAHPLGSHPIRMSFSPQRALLQTEVLLSIPTPLTIPQVKDVEVLGWHGYTWSAVVRPVGSTAKFSKTTLEAKLTLHSLATALLDIPAVSMRIAHSNLRHLWHCVWQNCTFQWPFIVPSTRCTCVMSMLFNQLLDLPLLSGGWIILAKEKCSLTGI